MNNRIMMKSYYPLAVLLLFTTLLAAPPILANNNTHQEDKRLEEWYFDEEELVETATRSPKPMARVAENVTVITAEEIEDMHAHTLAEVLNRQPGVFINFYGQDFLGDSSLFLLGSRQQHVLLLLDGVRLNHNSNGYALVSFVPLGIIKRIEIIKGAASSTWGSALGGVINIITKDVGKTDRPTGNVNVSYGEGNSRDISADAAGKVKVLSYYLYGGNIDSDGLRLDRYSERNSLYGKMQLDLPHSSRLTVTAGYSDPFNKSLNWEDAWGITDLNIYENIDRQNIWGTLYFDRELTKELSLHLSGQHFDNFYAANKRSLGTGLEGQGDLIFGEEWEEGSNSFTSRLTWTEGSVTANLGFESSRSEMRYASQSGIFFEGPSITADDPVTEDRHGVYANVTYVKGYFSITPGLRYDDHSNSEESVNPSVGITYLLTPNTLLRGSIAKGFSAPYLASFSHSPDLEPENTWTYQAGIETGRIPFLHLKGTVFHQNIEDAWNDDVTPWTNTGIIRLNGFEIEVKTAAYHGLVFTGNFTYVTGESKITDASTSEDDDTYTGNLILSYLNAAYGLRTELAGHYYWMSDLVKNEEPDHGNFIWDLLIAKDFDISPLNGEVYLKGHNIFNGNLYFDVDYPNPERWLEVGLAVKF
ncbi:MAG: TonB-dependent receptor [Candidatus Electrothrix sp.]